MIDIIHKCDIKPGYHSDHSFLEMHITINPFKKGRAFGNLIITCFIRKIT